MASDVHDKEKNAAARSRRKVEGALPGVEVLAVELTGPERFTVYVDHAAEASTTRSASASPTCSATTSREYTIDVSSPGLERPLRKPAHFERAVGRRVALRTADQIAGRKRFRGEVVAADERAVTGRGRRHRARSRTTRSCGEI